MVEVLHLDDESVIRVFVDPLHQRMLQALSEGPLTSAGLGRRLGLPAAKLHYHLKRMEQVGLLELDREEMIRGIRARYLRPAARRYELGQKALANPGDRAAVGSTFRDIAQRYFEGLDGLLTRTPGQDAVLTASLAREDLHLTKDEAEELWQSWEAALARARDHDRRHREAPVGSTKPRLWALLASAYPVAPDSPAQAVDDEVEEG